MKRAGLGGRASEVYGDCRVDAVGIGRAAPAWSSSGCLLITARRLGASTWQTRGSQTSKSEASSTCVVPERTTVPDGSRDVLPSDQLA